MSGQTKNTYLLELISGKLASSPRVCYFISPSDVSGTLGNTAVVKFTFSTISRFYWLADWDISTPNIQACYESGFRNQAFTQYCVNG